MANITVNFGTGGADGLGLSIDNILDASLVINPVILSPNMNVVIFPFPAGPDCCCPNEDVACLRRSADGEYYVASKGIQSACN